MLVMSEQSDVLSYGSEHENFVHTIDQVSISSWGEITTHRFLELEGLFDCCIAIINQNMQSIPVKIESYTPIRGKSIALGLTQLFQKLNQLFQKLNQLFISEKSTGNPRLIVAGETNYYPKLTRSKLAITRFGCLNADKAVKLPSL
jgi:adenylate cyclase class 1